MSKSPKKELEEFLAPKPSWLQKVLQQDSSMSYDEQLALSQSDWWKSELNDQYLRIQREYEAIIQRIPGEWQKYRKRASQPLVQLLIPKGNPGRPRKTALAEEAANLQRAGMKHPQIATELNRRHGKGTTTSEAVRKLLKRHPDKS